MPRLAPDYHSHYKPPRLSYLRSFLPIVALLLLLSFSLVSYSLLSHFRSPAIKQQIGWQAWDVVRVTSSKTTGGQGAIEDELDAAQNGTGKGDEGFMPSIPLDKWDPLSLHTTGLTEIAVKPCYFPPSMFPSYCAPDTTPELDKTKGKWVIVERDLNLRTGLWYLNVWYRRTRRLDVDLINDIRLVDEPPSGDERQELEQGGWIKAEGDVHSGIWPTQPEQRLWYTTKKRNTDDEWRLHRRQEGGIEESTSSPDDQAGQSDEGAVEVLQNPSGEFDSQDQSYITEFDVLYGDDDPFFGFKRIQGGVITPAKQGKWESVDIAVRRGNPVAPRAEVPKFHSDGTFKIMQIADLHYSVGNGECRDSDKQPCIGDPETATWLAEALDAERPDLVVFSGDQLNGQETSYDSRSVLAKFAKPVIDRKIPWAAVFGNHDSEIAEDRAQQMRALQHMPYSLARAGPKGVDGVGNYYIKLHSGDGSRMHLFTLYFLDSHDYQKKKLPWAQAEYDYIKENQISWYRNVSSSIAPIARPFQPDGAEDLGHVWQRSRKRFYHNRETRAVKQILAKPNAMMWFHIPLPEAYADPDVEGFDAEPLDVGSQMDGEGSSKHNSGMFYNGIKDVFEADQESPADKEEDADGWMEGVEGRGTRRTEVKVLSHGHCHNTDRCRRIDGVWMCFDGGSSYSGYGQLGFDRRVRVYQISGYGEKIETYKRLTSGEILDQQVLVGDGAPKGWGEDQHLG
ncbi:hypothetical protein IAU60_001801 [Kwoniella sp. DSM 27419]